MSKNLFLKNSLNLTASALFSLTIFSSEAVYGMDEEISPDDSHSSVYINISDEEISDDSYFDPHVHFKHIEENSEKISEEILLEIATEYRTTGYSGFARNLFEKLETRGNSEALRQLGEMYSWGEGVVTYNPQQAKDYFKQAIEKNNSNAMVDLARLYNDGEYTSKNPEKVKNLYKRALKLNNEDARLDNEEDKIVTEEECLDDYNPKKAQKLDEQSSTPKSVHLQKKSNVTSWDALQLNFGNVNIDK